MLISLPIGDISHIPIICGPTASGKSRLAMSLCEEVGGEILSCDSMQIYRGMNIGTAKANADDQKKIRHHLIDIADPMQPFSVAAYLDKAYASIEDVLTSQKLPVLCGGTGQYASALSEGIEYYPMEISPETRQTVIDIISIDGGVSAYIELQKVDPVSAAKIHPNNTKRIIRALEVYHQSNQPISAIAEKSKENGPKYPFKLFALDIPREELYSRINQRVDKMIEDGLEEEVKELFSTELEESMTSIQAIGYKEFIEYSRGLRSYDETILLIKQRSRNYAKRQLTWFRHMKNVIWITPDDLNVIIDSITLDLA